MCKFKAFVHISTAYANCDQFDIAEHVYTPQVMPDKLIDAVEWIEDDILESITPKLIKDKPNTYTYTKAIAESLVIEECKNIPCAIIRPSIISASWREPFSGWLDNFYGPSALFPAIGTGLLRSMIGKEELIADIIPVDVTVNLMISAAWYSSLKITDDIIVYNCTSGQINRLTWSEFKSYGMNFFMRYPFENVVLIPNPHFTTSK